MAPRGAALGSDGPGTATPAAAQASWWCCRTAVPCRQSRAIQRLAGPGGGALREGVLCRSARWTPRQRSSVSAPAGTSPLYPEESRALITYSTGGGCWPNDRPTLDEMPHARPEEGLPSCCCFVPGRAGCLGFSLVGLSSGHHGMRGSTLDKGNFGPPVPGRGGAEGLL